jgi:hypothetical protein
MRVLIACEFSGTVRDAFARLGHDAWSCDLLPTESPGNHIQGDVLGVVGMGWDLMVAHPPCQFLTRAGAKWFLPEYVGRFPDRAIQRERALAFVRALMAAPIPHIAIENPVGSISSRIRKADQTIQPYMFGHGEQKATCLWLKNLPLLRATKHVPGREQRLYHLSPSPDRWKERSKTFQGIADAMADQWSQGDLPVQLQMFA